jgi:hypothetical protein
MSRSRTAGRTRGQCWEKSNWGLPQCAGSSRDVHRFTGHEGGLRKSEVPTTDKQSSPLSIYMLYLTAVIPLVGKQPVLVRSRTGDFSNVQDSAQMSTDLLRMRKVRL